MSSAKSKPCGKCGEVKDLFLFSRNKRSPDGRHSVCKACRKESAALYRKREDVAAREKDRLKQDYLDNREERLAARKLRYANNREATLAQNNAWREANLEKHRALCRQWAKEHPLEMRAIVARRRALIAQAEGQYSKQDVERMLVEQDGFCLACRGDLWILGFHVDHIHPLSKGGSNGPENLQLLCPTCNRKKGAKLPDGL